MQKDTSMNTRSIAPPVQVLTRAYARVLRAGFLLIALIAAWMALNPLSAQAQTSTDVASPYRYTLPTGWTRSSDGTVEAFTPTAEPQGNVQIMLLAPKPLTGDFNAQFASERAALESFWGMRAPQPAAPQSGQITAGPYAAYFASYDSDAGQRYMSFLAMGQQGQFGMLVFVAATSEDFNRLAPVATQLFSGMSIIASVKGEAKPPEPVKAEARPPASVKTEVPPKSVKAAGKQPEFVRAEVPNEPVNAEVSPPKSVKAGGRQPEFVKAEVMPPASVKAEVASPASVKTEVMAKKIGGTLKIQNSALNAADEQQAGTAVAPDEQRLLIRGR